MLKLREVQKDLKRSLPEVRVTSEQELCVQIIYIVEQTSLDCFNYFLKTRENAMREHIPVPHDNLFQSILSFASRCQSYFQSRSHDPAGNRQRSSGCIHLNKKLKIQWVKRKNKFVLGRCTVSIGNHFQSWAGKLCHTPA